MEGGIYKIINIITSKVYVGSTINFNVRWKRHLRDLKNNKHDSIKLQNSYNKYGIDNFIFEIITPIFSMDKLIETEQFYIDEFDSYNNGYNCAPIAV